mgnify:CR=1 FL=1
MKLINIKGDTYYIKGGTNTGVVKLDEDKLDKKALSHIKKQCEKAKLEFSDKKTVNIKCNINDPKIHIRYSGDLPEDFVDMVLKAIEKTNREKFKRCKNKIKSNR